MDPKNQQPERSSEPRKAQGNQAKSTGGENRKDGPRYDDRPPRPDSSGPKETTERQTTERPTPGEAPRTTREPVEPTPNPNRDPGPRYGDGEGDDPRRGTVEAGGSPEQSDKSGR